jgi:methyl-accepting chemotaxis protein
MIESTKKPRSKWTKRKYFVDKRLQTKYALLTVLLLLIYSLLFALILFTPYIFKLETGATLEEKAAAARMLLELHESVWPALGTVVAILGVVSIFVTHKIAGPVYRFKKDLSEVCAGNLDISFKLRRRDDLKDLAESLNMVIAELRTCVHTLQQDHASRSACIAELEAQVRDNKIDSEAARGIIEMLQKNSQQTAKAIEKYNR